MSKAFTSFVAIISSAIGAITTVASYEINSTPGETNQRLITRFHKEKRPYVIVTQIDTSKKKQEDETDNWCMLVFETFDYKPSTSVTPEDKCNPNLVLN